MPVAMLFAAGLGTRLRPLTDDRPKALVEVAGQPLLGWNLRRLYAAGIRQMVVNVHHFAPKVIAYLQKVDLPGLDLRISDESEALLETGGGLKKAAPLFEADQDILLWNVDVLSDLNLEAFFAFHHQQQSLATLAVRQRTSSRYLQVDEAGRLCGWEHAKTGEVRRARSANEVFRRAFSGIHLLRPHLLDLLTETGKFSIIDSYLRLAADHNLFTYDHSDGFWLDVGKPESLPVAADYLQTQGYASD